jgi:hypothetical protein
MRAAGEEQMTPSIHDASPPALPNPRARHPTTVRAAPLDRPAHGFPVVNAEQQAAYDWLLARLFGPEPPPTPDDATEPTAAEGPAPLAADERQGEVAS